MGDLIVPWIVSLVSIALYALAAGGWGADSRATTKDDQRRDDGQ